MSNTASDVLRIAASQLGLKDGTKYGNWYASLVNNQAYARKGVAWCAMFTSWVFAQAGARCAGLPNAYCPTIYNQAKAKGKLVAAKDAKAGDVVLFDWDGGLCDHVGIVEMNKGSYLQTIEGNTSGMVARRTRGFSVIKTCIRPDYSTTTESKPQTGSQKPTAALAVDGVFGTLTKKALQTSLQKKGYYKGAIDGIFGTMSTKALQSYLRKLGDYQFAADGILGVRTKAGLQLHLKSLGYYKASVDGVWGAVTTKALQQALNANKF